MRFAPSRDRQRQLWVLIRSGCELAEAARRVGVPLTTAHRWFVQAGGMPPVTLRAPASGRYLSILERERILAGMHAGLSIRAIARDIGRAPSTVQRELAKNLRHQQYRSRKVSGAQAWRRRRLNGWNYSPSLAHGRAERDRSRPKVAKLADNWRLRDEVQRRLLLKHSPEQISATLRLEFSSEQDMQVSPETIYQSLYVQGRGALRRELSSCLRTGRALRKPRRAGSARRSRIPNMVNIAERPAEANDRAVPGHWEGDLITGTENKSAIGTLVERTSGFVVLLHLPNDHSAPSVEQAMIEQISQLPALLKKTLTWDQGGEMANHVRIAAATGIDIYFCDPHSPWQRGSNENTNGLLRQYFPKGTDLSGYHPDYLHFVAAELNSRPRKRHGWKTPARVLDELLSAGPPSVASTA
jgi:IS30 family transposase